MAGGQGPTGANVPFDTSRAHMARVYDFWLGGKDNFAADRAVAEQVAAAYPDIGPRSGRSARSWPGRCTSWSPRRVSGSSLTSGPGCPRRTTPTRSPRRRLGSRGWCTWTTTRSCSDHARALLTSSPEGATAYIDADLRDTGTILERAADLLDFGQPVAVMLLGILQGIPDREEPGAIIARLMDAVPPGSYLAVTQIAGDVAADEVAEGVQRYNEQAAAPVAARTHAEASRFFAGLDLVEPGVVQVHRWRAGTGDPGNGRNLAIYAGVARKP